MFHHRLNTEQSPREYDIFYCSAKEEERNLADDTFSLSPFGKRISRDKRAQPYYPEYGSILAV